MWVRNEGQRMVNGKEYFVLQRSRARLYPERVFWSDEHGGFIKQGGKVALKHIEYYSREPEPFEPEKQEPAITITRADFIIFIGCLTLIGAGMFALVVSGADSMAKNIGSLPWVMR